MKKILILFIVLLVISACGKSGGNKPENPLNEQVEENKTPVIIEKIELKALEQYITLTGKLEGITDIVLTSETNGKIISINKRLGDWVKSGDEIGKINNKDYEIQFDQAKASVLASTAAFELTELQMESSENLYKREIISKAEFYQATGNYKNALAGLNAAQAGLEQAKKALDNSRFVSPASGYIADLAIEIGETISFGQPICSIVDSKKLIIKTGLGEKEIIRIKKGQKVNIFSGLVSGSFEGVVTGIGIKPHNNSASYPIEIQMDNPEGKLLPGMVVSCRILSDTFSDVFFTSLNNIKQEYDNRFVFVIDEYNIAHKKFVQLGLEVGENVIINEGLELGDQLVIEGMENLEEGSKVDIRQGIEQ